MCWYQCISKGINAYQKGKCHSYGCMLQGKLGLVMETMLMKSIGKDYIQSNGLLIIKPNQMD